MEFVLRKATGRTAAKSGMTVRGLALRGWRPMLASAALAGLAMFLMPVWAYALMTCGSSISSCCKITTSGSYSVSGNFGASGYAACIRIKASNVSLNGNGDTISGPGASSTMKGLVIAPGANNAFVGSLTMSGFATGVEVDANRVLLGSVYVNDSGTGIIVNGNRAFLYQTAGSFNLHNGMVVNGKAFTGFIFGGKDNNGNGVVFNPTAVGVYALYPVGNSNLKAGVKIKGLSGGWFQNAEGDSNGTYGVWLRGTRGVSLSDFFAESNGIAGVYLGCHGDFPSTAACPASIPRTNGNILASTNLSSPASSANGGTSPVQPYGVVIDLGNYLNRVSYVAGDSNSAFDGYDSNPNCANNVWLYNKFTSANRTCVDFAVY